MLSCAFETVAEPRDIDLGQRRLARWCAASARGDWAVFAYRLRRDGLAIDDVRARFEAPRLRVDANPPRWFADAQWVREVVCDGRVGDDQADSRYPFEALFSPLADAAAGRLWGAVGCAADRFSPLARDSLRSLLLAQLCHLSAPALYERFVEAADYRTFLRLMKHGGLQQLFDEKPVLLRLLATSTRQWLDTSREFVERLDSDVAGVCHALLSANSDGRVAFVGGGLSDPHRGGHSVLSVQFDDGRTVMYKPKDLRVDVAWRALVERLNVDAPITLRTARVVAREGYGWTEFVDHGAATGTDDCRQFYRRVGAWLALCHCFAAGDMHQDNLIASGDHPVLVDLETILQPDLEHRTDLVPEAAATSAAREMITSSVLSVGLLPVFARSPDNDVYSVGGVADAGTSRRLRWVDVNSDSMRPEFIEHNNCVTNLPTLGGRPVRMTEHLDDVVAGFEDYAAFLRRHARADDLFAGFSGLPVRKVIRPTQFYSLLLRRLRDVRTMDDGVAWSAQADFLARLADWDHDDPLWPLQRAERSALLELNVPLFTVATDSSEITDSSGLAVQTSAVPGLQRASERVRRLDEREITWQTGLIREASVFASGSESDARLPEPAEASVQPGAFAAEADAIAAEIAERAVRRNGSAAWVGLNPVGDSDVSQLAVLGPDLYNGACGIAVFFAAHAATSQDSTSAELAIGALAQLRAELRGRNAAHMARVYGIGGGIGLGSIVYALCVISVLLQDDSMLADAERAAMLIDDELIATDKRLDVMAGCAGAVLGLLRLYRDIGVPSVLERAVECGEHLLACARTGPTGARSWVSTDPDGRALAGMSHGAAGFAYALSALAAATGREDFADAASECLRFERSTYDERLGDWIDVRVGEPHSRAQWCHGAVGIGLARLAMLKVGSTEGRGDIEDALAAATRGWPGHADTLCCGAAGNVELLREAAVALNRAELDEVASRRLAWVFENRLQRSDYRWKGGSRRLNVGLFRGLAGIGYTYLRHADSSLPNVLVWQ